MKLSSQNGFRLIEEFEAAVREHEMAGAAPPGDREAIDTGYTLRKEKLRRFLVECLLIVSCTPAEVAVSVRKPIEKGVWVEQLRGKSRGRVGLVSRVYDNGRAVVQFGSGGPFDEFALSSLIPATAEQIAVAEGEA